MSMAKPLSDYDAGILDIILRYHEENPDKPFETAYVAAWAMNNELWSGPPARSLLKTLKKELSRVAKTARHTDKQGRRGVRTWCAAKVACTLSDGKVVQKILWDHLESMSLDHAQASFHQRWDQLGGAAAALRRDTNSFNDNNPNAIGNEIQLTFNFEFATDKALKQETQEIPVPELVIGQHANEHERPSSPLP